MANSLEEIDSLLSRAQPVNDSAPASTLREWRTEMVRASVFVSYALSVLSLDSEILEHSTLSTREDLLQSLVDDLPSILASGWVGGGWSLAPDASASVGAASELEIDESMSLLDLHAEMVTIDFNDAEVVHDLLTRIKEQRQDLMTRRDQLQERIHTIQETLKRHYATGAASIDDWLS